MTRKFYNQFGQDKYCLHHFLRETTTGFFLEIGADDGVDKNNNLFFEETLGWNGICIGPSPARSRDID